MTNGYIFSAGNEIRFDSTKPKALSHIDGVCLLDYNIKVLESICDDVYVVVSSKNKHFFDGYNTIVIDSGKGCGDAVMKALLHKACETCVILWGDCIADIQVLNKAYSSYVSNPIDIVVPCTFEENPYVRLEQKERGKILVDFAKYGEVKSGGFHDYGLFVGNGGRILDSLTKFEKNINVDGMYRHKHGNEMQFLDVFNETSIVGRIIPIHGIPTKSFNTAMELELLYKDN